MSGTSIAARTIKYDYRMAEITSAWKVKRRSQWRTLRQQPGSEAYGWIQL